MIYVRKNGQVGIMGDSALDFVEQPDELKRSKIGQLKKLYDLTEDGLLKLITNGIRQNHPDYLDLLEEFSIARWN